MPEVRAAVLRRDAERLALAGRDVRAVRAGRGEDREADRLDDRDEQGAGGVGQPPDLGHRLEQAEEVGLRRDHARRPAVGVGQHPLERREVGRAGGVARRSTSGISSSSSPPVEVRRERLRGSADGRRARSRTRSRRVARQVIRAASAVAAAPS